MTREITVGVDIGTTSVKALAVDGDGRVVARARVPHGFSTPAPDELVHDARRAWRRGPRAALAALGDVGPVSGMCVSAMVPSLTSVNGRGVPVGPGVLYGDRRGRNDAGLPDPLGQFPALVAWAAAEHPGARGYWPAQAVANFALGGEAVVDTAVAGTAFPLFDGAGWDGDRAAACGVRPEQLPRVVATGAPAGRVGDAVLASGVVDGMAEQMVAGAVHDGDVLVLLGATLITWVVTTQWLQVPALMTFPQPNGTFAIGGPSNAGGLFIEWTAGLGGRGPRPDDPGRVPVWLPYPRGERAPYHDPDRRASLHDLDMVHGPGSLGRAAFEASGFVVRHVCDLVGLPTRRIVATGGGTRSPEWVQALADTTNLPVDLVAVPEGAALGAAFTARVAAGLEGSLAGAVRWARTGGRVEPDPAWARSAAVRYERFRTLSG